MRDASHTYTFAANDNGRNASASLNGSTAGTYLYNAFEQRVQKVAGGVTTQFVFDRFGHLLEEANSSGTVQKEYIWLDDLPVAMVDATTNTIYFIHTDQLGTPQKITDSSANVVWDGVYDPFGLAVSVSSLWGSPTQWGSFTWEPTTPAPTNLRFPGQYADAETALNQNWNRDYDPTIGRYIQSDPLGLWGGINTYAYVDGKPSLYVDPTGQDVWIEGPSPDEPAGHQSINVGDPNGSYTSYSFGVNGDPWLGGSVYQDMEHGGDISPDHYLHTDANDDARARRMLDPLLGQRAPYRPWRTCRNFSQTQFDRIVGAGIGSLAAPPKRRLIVGGRSRVPFSTSTSASDWMNLKSILSSTSSFGSP